jgi:hypothetical protein
METIITLVVVMTINGQEFERHEIMPNIEQCWRVAAERYEKLVSLHNITLKKLGIGCVWDAGEDL